MFAVPCVKYPRNSRSLMTRGAGMRENVLPVWYISSLRGIGWGKLEIPVLDNIESNDISSQENNFTMLVA
jgi:hypothetical protein